MIINTPIATLKAYTPNPEFVIESAARECWDSDMPEDGLIRSQQQLTNPFLIGVIKSGHESVLEHASATFRITNVSRALTHQLVRHRLCSFSQKSQRYVKEDQFEFVTPPSIAALDMTDDFAGDMAMIQQMYDRWIARGVKKEDARFVLPNACTTNIWVTANFRQWRNVLKLRTDKHAQWEIRLLAKNIAPQLFDIAPNVFADLVEV